VCKLVLVLFERGKNSDLYLECMVIALDTLFLLQEIINRQEIMKCFRIHIISPNSIFQDFFE
jgi:hypothetical protein